MKEGNEIPIGDQNICLHGNFAGSCSTCAEIMKEKNGKWQEITDKVKKIKDGTSSPVDEGIKEAQTSFMALDFPVNESCEGHLDHGEPFPWIDINYPLPDEWWEDKKVREEMKDKIMSAHKEWREKIDKLLEEFYNNRLTDPGLKITMKDQGIFGAFRLQSAEAEKAADNPAEDFKKQKLEAFRKEMKDFADFLRKKYFKIE
jgi:hypothetical protein